VAVPFRDAEEIRRAGAAGFLRILPGGGPGAFRGALFLVNARSEPLEFAYNRIRLPQPFLWRGADLAEYATRRLAASLFEVCPRPPALLLCLEREVGPRLFARDLDLAVPVARLAAPGTRPGEGEEAEEAVGSGTLLWAGRRPADGDRAWVLLDRLAERGLLSEPFRRAARGLAEVYGHGAHGEEDDGELVEGETDR
jgi:hypothetical protein